MSDFLHHQWRARLKKRRGRSLNTISTRELNLVAMMDMLTIILVFLLKSYSASALSIQVGESIQIPTSTRAKAAEDAVKLMLTRVNGEQPGYISIDEEPVLKIDKKLYNSLKRKARRRRQKDFLIPELQTILLEKAAQARHLAKAAIKVDEEAGESLAFEGKILIIADKGTPYWLITQVLYTCAESGFDQYSLVATKKNQ